MKAIRQSPLQNNSELGTYHLKIVYFKRFIYDIKTLAATLSALVRKENNFEWTLIRELNFFKIKERMMSSLNLHIQRKI